ncbi:hypothetical protein PHYPSEUDO_015096 [Phytophthora pseudosyringae]|uniref:Uncharacterized protein n=1 Tax=Phytophthora pseudosyringae TaxID=221518 RepID=A0A8T1W0K5_9STRA|nr:hypothetical protein PHYPSEUDO_015096 [Phytophthora pseudosyringae]
MMADDEAGHLPPVAVASDLSLDCRSVEAPRKTEVFPVQLAMQFPYRLEEFHVRECYPIYYRLTMHELFELDMRCVTITGVRGIGKSVFYGYFSVVLRAKKLSRTSPFFRLRSRNNHLSRRSLCLKMGTRLENAKDQVHTT